VIAFLEETFGIVIDPGQHDLPDFDSVDKIANLVTDLQASRGSS
jgi:acyl carrier protein